MVEVYEKIPSLTNELLRHTSVCPLFFLPHVAFLELASIKNYGIFRTAMAKISLFLLLPTKKFQRFKEEIMWYVALQCH